MISLTATISRPDGIFGTDSPLSADPSDSR
jgi:hypothetical protein